MKQYLKKLILQHIIMELKGYKLLLLLMKIDFSSLKKVSSRLQEMQIDTSGKFVTTQPIRKAFLFPFLSLFHPVQNT